MMQENMEKVSGCNMPGWTRHLLLVTKLVPGLTLGTTDGTYKETFKIGLTRKYFYKIEGASDTRDRYVLDTP